MKAKVYFNLHKRLFSVVVDGRVKYHATIVLLKDCTFKVSEAGRQRVLREKRKNVHAFVCGELIVMDLPLTLDNPKPISYNPYKYNSFVLKDTEERIDNADLVYLTAVGERTSIFVLE